MTKPMAFWIPLARIVTPLEGVLTKKEKGKKGKQSKTPKKKAAKLDRSKPLESPIAVSIASQLLQIGLKQSQQRGRSGRPPKLEHCSVPLLQITKPLGGFLPK